ncbi:hypothetical protein [Georgenia sp. H159]|uniref:hypothetical protein n=1 Tax=Georgenia sp. H159 TaxID=3076115 RepID=UPI002D775DB8|nr:hypothetical protein [Georgenia sp. H159]
MTHVDHDESAAVPLLGYISFEAPSDVISLYSGPMRLPTSDGSTPERPGTITLGFRSGSHLDWTVDLSETSPEDRRPWRHRVGSQTVELGIDFNGVPMTLETYSGGDGRGFFGHRTVSADNDVLLSSVTAHWVNLPQLGAETLLCQEDDDGNWREWHGRSTMTFAGWEVTFDERADLFETLAAARRDRLFAVTHVMRIQRDDGELFAAEEGEQIVAGLQLGLSFALGRWAAPILPVGVDDTGAIAWSEWAAMRVDSLVKAHGQWWDRHRPQDLRHFLEQFVSQCLDPDERRSLGFVTTSAIIAGESGFVEQRLITALAALEHLHWRANEVDDGDPPKRLRRLLTAASINIYVESTNQPALALYANGQDGPKVLYRVRNALMHPKRLDGLYAHEGLIWQASLLASRYLDLVILYRLGYHGYVTDRTRTTGWETGGAPVPWAEADTEAG